MPYKFLTAAPAFPLVWLAALLDRKINMNVLRRSLFVVAVYGTVAMLLMLILSACDGMPVVTPYVLAGEGQVLSTPVLSDMLCGM